MTPPHELRKLAKKATPGPWRVVIDDDGNPLSGRPSIDAPPELDCSIIHPDGFVQEYWRSARGDKEIHANAAFIAAANPQVILALLDQNEALRKALEPFAALAGHYDTEHENDTTWDNDFRPRIGDLRNAAKALEQKP